MLRPLIRVGTATRECRVCACLMPRLDPARPSPAPLELVLRAVPLPATVSPPTARPRSMVGAARLSRRPTQVPCAPPNRRIDGGLHVRPLRDWWGQRGRAWLPHGRVLRRQGAGAAPASPELMPLLPHSPRRHGRRAERLRAAFRALRSPSASCPTAPCHRTRGAAWVARASSVGVSRRSCSSTAASSATPSATPPGWGGPPGPPPCPVSDAGAGGRCTLPPPPPRCPRCRHTEASGAGTRRRFNSLPQSTAGRRSWRTRTRSWSG